MRELFGDQCIDYPKAEVLYKGHDLSKNHRLYGNGFTLYTGLLDDIVVDRFRIQERIVNDEFDLVIFGCINAQYGLFTQLRPWLNTKNTIVMDGADSPWPYPTGGHFWRKAYYWGLPRAHRKFLYFKREWTEETYFSLLEYILPARVRSSLAQAQNLRKIAFSIPSEKVVSELPKKAKNFPKHIVDTEVVNRVPEAATSYAFTSEAEYYRDLQLSRFGITTKRAGWDCMRHYEIAANGAVPCFRDLNKKPPNCAPHGLDATNSITYRSAAELLAKVERITDEEYAVLQGGAFKWVKAQTTAVRAGDVIQAVKKRQMASDARVS